MILPFYFFAAVLYMNSTYVAGNDLLSFFLKNLCFALGASHNLILDMFSLAPRFE